jgi:hypothetical protein
MIGEYRLLICEHFDSVTSEIDLFIEKELLLQLQSSSDYVKAENELNSKRDTLLKYVKEAEQFNLKMLNQTVYNSRNNHLSMEELFPQFCFILQFEKELRLVLTDKFISQDELKLLKRFIQERLSRAEKSPFIKIAEELTSVHRSRLKPKPSGERGPCYVKFCGLDAISELFEINEIDPDVSLSFF